jgi:glycine/D-amino acid oxidase-like deaminating enzyme/nitrite reductase/ring-hydroxylating ferredoxin subunit
MATRAHQASAPRAAKGSPWLEQATPQFPALDRDLAVDVVVVGAGITGVTTAWLLQEAGCSVALLDRDRAGRADTGHTTAHLTCVTDTRLHDLVRRIGEDGAGALWHGGAVAIDQIEAIIKDLRVDCGFRRVPGFLHAPIQRHAAEARHEREREALREDAALATRVGFNAKFIEDVPRHGVPGVQFAAQAAFDPGRYHAALLQGLAQTQCQVFEHTEVDSIDPQSHRVTTSSGHAVDCSYVVIATHNPLAGSLGVVRATLFQTKVALYTSYVLGAQMPAGSVPDALFWDTSDPYEYLRIEPRNDHQLVIFGGADAKTGQQSDEQAFEALESRLLARLPDAQVTRRWMGQVIESADGLPYIGEHAPGEFIATAFAGNGFTFGTLAAMMARDAFLGRTNPWAELLRVERKPFHGGMWRYVSENVDYPRYLLGDRLRRAHVRDLADVPLGEGRIVALKSGKCAAYRDKEGQLSLCSAVCTHLKCLVRWNAAAGTWDCPCHGSRFAVDGSVLAGPAEEPLERIQPDRGDRPN